MDSTQQNTKKRNTPSPTTRELMSAILEFKIDRVSELLANGVSVDRATANGLTLLMVVLIEWEEKTTVIVEKLLEAKASVIHTCTDRGWTALHYGAKHGNLRVLQLLAARTTILDPRNHDGKAPLDLLCRRTGVDPACVDVLCQGNVTEYLLRKAFNTACRHSDAPVVQRVLTHLDTLLGKSAPLVQSDFWACLANKDHCGSLFALLQDRFQWLTPTLDSDEFQEMLRQGDAALAARFARYARKNPWVRTKRSITALRSRPNDTNFMPFLLAAQTAGWNVTTAHIKSFLYRGPSSLLRALLQMGAYLVPDADTSQTKTQIIKSQLRENYAGDTELHQAVRAGKLNVVKNCFQRRLNPFVANHHGLLPIQLAQGPAIQQVLRGYMRTSVRNKTEKDVRVPVLDWQVIRWYGPYFESIAKALLQVRCYYRRHYNVHFPRDVLPNILDYVAWALFPFYRE